LSPLANARLQGQRLQERPRGAQRAKKRVGAPAPSLVRSSAMRPPREAHSLDRTHRPLWKFVKPFAHGTKVFSLSPHYLQADLSKDIWQVLYPDLVS
jgi:hypothetical protein